MTKTEALARPSLRAELTAVLADRDKLIDLLDQASEELTGGGECSRRQMAERIDAELGKHGHGKPSPPPQVWIDLVAALCAPVVVDSPLTQEAERV